MVAARMATVRASVHLFSDDYPRAVAELEDGLRACPIDTCPLGIGLTSNLAAALGRNGDAARAHELRVRALAELADRYGSDSPATLQTRLDLVDDLLHAGDIDEGDAELRAAERIIEQWFPGNHSHRWQAMNHRAEILLARGDAAAAVPVFEQEIASVEAALGVDDLRLASDYNDLGYALFMAGRGAEALAALEHGRELTARVGPGTFDHGALLITLGYVRGELGQRAAALEDLREAKHVLEPLLGPTHPAVVQCDTNTGHLLEAMNRCADAVPVWEAVVHSPTGSLADPDNIALRIELADCYLALDRSDRARRMLDEIDPAKLDAEERVRVDAMRSRLAP
jgi:tetratricopeptide (TPR) repeat protein